MLDGKVGGTWGWCLKTKTEIESRDKGWSLRLDAIANSEFLNLEGIIC